MCGGARKKAARVSAVDFLPLTTAWDRNAPNHACLQSHMPAVGQAKSCSQLGSPRLAQHAPKGKEVVHRKVIAGAALIWAEVTYRKPSYREKPATM